MVLLTLKASPPVYSHSNRLVENVMGRIGPGALMHYMSAQVGIDFSFHSPWWSWARRHASWLLNRFGPAKGMSPYEIINGKKYTGKVCRLENLFLIIPSRGKSSSTLEQNGVLGKVRVS